MQGQDKYMNINHFTTFNFSVNVIVYEVEVFKAYLESISKMYIFSPTDTNLNPIVPSLCLVFLNAHLNVHN